MIEKPPVDNSKFILSPMPGKLVSMLVEDGQQVRSCRRIAAFCCPLRAAMFRAAVASVEPISPSLFNGRLRPARRSALWRQ